jgi:SNF2 family DNA or RNA helicase
MGCGKTLTAIAVAGAGFKLGKIKKVLIVAPTSVCAVWPKEFQEYADFRYTVKLLLGDKKKRIKALDDLEAFPFTAMKVAVINYESTWREGIFDRLLEFDADLIIADESQRIKTHDASQSKAMHQLGDKARYKLILSGTPVQNEAIDIFSQYRFLDPTIFGPNFYAFRSRYAVMGGFNRKQIVQYRDLDQLIKKEHSIAYRVTKEEALDLPEQTFENRYITLDTKERNLYDRLRRDSYAELSDGGTITATTVLTKLLRLQQFTGGFLVEDDAVKPQLVSTGKLDALADILQDYVIEGKKKLVIFARFLPEIHEIEKLCEKVLMKHGLHAESIYGGIPKESRGAIVREFQETPECMVFIGQIDTAGTGITLTAADTCVYYSVNFNYATYSQSLARIHRIGQHHPCTYIHLVVENTVDSTILDALSKKEDLAKTVVDSWRDYF